MYINKYVNQGGESMPEYKVWRIVSTLCLLITIINVLTNIRFRLVLNKINEVKNEIASMQAESGDSGDVDK